MITFEINKEAHPNKSEVLEKGKEFNIPFLISAIKVNYSLIAEVSKLNIKFEDCTFNRNVFFHIDLDEFKMRELHISFSNCFILGDDQAFENKIRSKEGSELHVSFFNCILENITFDKAELNYLGVFNSVIQKSYFSIRDSRINSVHFYNVLGNYGVNRTKNANINIRYGDDNLYIPSKAISKRMKELGNSLDSIYAFPSKILITEPKRLFVEFKKSSKIGFTKSFKGFHYCLSENQVNSLDITLSVQTENNTTESIKIDKAILNGFVLSNTSNAIIEILRSKINRVFIRDLSFQKLKIYDLSSRSLIESVFESRNVDFSNATFDKTDLSSYKMVSFYRSTLTDINFISPKFPEEIHVLDNIHYPDKKEEDYFRMQSENYRQIKKSLISSGNQIHALEIHSKMYLSLQKDKLLSTQDKVILCLNKISNNHGVSITRPFILLCIMAMIIFFFYRTSLNEAPYILGYKDMASWGEGILANWKFVFKDFKSFWLLVNPTHKLSTLEGLEPESKLNSWSLFFSYFSRILMAWIIYQFVVSFRKFGRKL